jgi:hypothetical protein
MALGPKFEAQHQYVSDTNVNLYRPVLKVSRSTANVMDAHVVRFPQIWYFAKLWLRHSFNFMIAVLDSETRY